MLQWLVLRRDELHNIKMCEFNTDQNQNRHKRRVGIIKKD